jgi:hypothetical protein
MNTKIFAGSRLTPRARRVLARIGQKTSKHALRPKVNQSAPVVSITETIAAVIGITASAGPKTSVLNIAPSKCSDNPGNVPARICQSTTSAAVAINKGTHGTEPDRHA